MSHVNSATYSSPPLPLQNRVRDCLGNRGFTMIELIVVMAILGVLVLLAIPSYGKLKDTAREARAMEEIRGIEKAVNSYFIDKGSLPQTTLANGDSGLTLLGVPLVDPWGRPYVYVNILSDGEAAGRRGAGGMEAMNSDFDLYSKGKDGQTGTPSDVPDATDIDMDDIARAGDGGFVGLVLHLLP